jgi:hypothetical protein
MSGKVARSYFEQRGSTLPVPVSHSDLEALAHDSQLALYHVAAGLLSQARQDVARALTRADRALESLNRESLSAQQLLDACLFLARAHLMARDHTRALDQALECRRRVPELQPDPKMHPPEIIGLVAEAEAELRLRNPGSLRIESEPDGCTVYVNGRPLGRAPLELPQLSPGEYRLQAECTEGEIGRVHRVSVSNSRVVKRIDTRFDAAVVTVLDLSLRYTDAASQQAHGVADAIEVGRVVGANTVLWTHPALDERLQPEQGIVEVSRLRVRDGALEGRVLLRGNDDKSASLALAALETGRTTDTSDAPAHDLDDSDAASAVTPRAKQPVVASSAPASETSKRAVSYEPRDRATKPNQNGGTSTLAPILMTGAGAAMLVGGTIIAVLGHDRLSTLEAKCPSGVCTYPGYEDDVHAGRTLTTLADVLLIAGAATAITGAVWWLLSGRSTAAAPVSALCLPGRCSLLMTGTL